MFISFFIRAVVCFRTIRKYYYVNDTFCHAHLVLFTFIIIQLLFCFGSRSSWQKVHAIVIEIITFCREECQIEFVLDLVLLKPLCAIFDLRLLYIVIYF